MIADLANLSPTAWLVLMGERPECVTDEMLRLLNTIRRGGHFNMRRVGPRLEKAFGLTASAAADALAYWMATSTVQIEEGAL